MMSSSDPSVLARGRGPWTSIPSRPPIRPHNLWGDTVGPGARDVEVGQEINASMPDVPRRGTLLAVRAELEREGVLKPSRPGAALSPALEDVRGSEAGPGVHRARGP